MKFIKQTVSGKNKGNCLGACMSSLTGISLDKFPVLEKKDDHTRWDYAFKKVLNENNYDMLVLESEVYVEDLKSPILACGESPNYPGQLHSVLW